MISLKKNEKNLLYVLSFFIFVHKIMEDTFQNVNSVLSV